jgi:hypothetical protein
MNMIMILINFMINVVLPNCRNRNASSNFESNFEKDGRIYSCHAAERVFEAGNMCSNNILRLRLNPLWCLISFFTRLLICF